MYKINGIGLQNFRAFKKRQWFSFAPLTVLTGTNSSGKSTVINILELLTSNEERSDQSFFRLGLPDINFKHYSLYSRSLSNRLGDFSTFPSLKEEPVVISFQHFSKELNSLLELSLSYLPGTNKNVVKGILSEVVIRDVDNNKELLRVQKRKEEGVETTVDYGYLLKKIEQQLKSKNIDGLTGYLVGVDRSFSPFKEGEFKKIKADALRFFNNEIPILKYSFESNQSFDWNTEDILAEGDQRDFEAEKSSFLSLHAEQIAEEGGLHPFLSRQEKRFFTLVSFKTRDRTIEVPSIIDAIVSPFRSWNEISFEHQNAIVEYWQLKYGKISVDNNKKSFCYFIFNYLGGILKNIFEGSNFNPIFLKPARAEVVRSFQDNNSSFFSNQIYRISNVALSTFRFEKGIDSLNFIDYAIKLLDIGDRLSIQRNPDSSSNIVYIIRNDEKRLVSDLGYGALQVLSIIFEIALNIQSISLSGHPDDHIDNFYFKDKYEMYGGTIVIEEPEANLHPANQSKLADIIVFAMRKFGIQFIIETHSEYFIRKLQYLISKETFEVQPENIKIYYFYPPHKVPEGEEQIKEIMINRDGSLTDDFGSGFFDEADKIALELFLLKKNQKN